MENNCPCPSSFGKLIGVDPIASDPFLFNFSSKKLYPWGLPPFSAESTFNVQRSTFNVQCASRSDVKPGCKSPSFGSYAVGVQSENDEWKCLTNSLSPRIARQKENRWTLSTSGSNDGREAYPGKSASRKQDPHPA